jgi:DNA-binding HxlR family transcriptional regulator
MSARSYGQLCALATALDEVGDLWALLVVRELLLGPKRFKSLAEGLPGVGTNTLAARLKQLEADGVITRETLPPPASAQVYTLTPRGHALRPVVLALVRWGAPSIGKRPVEHPIRANWLGMALEAFCRPPPPRIPVELSMPTGVITARASGEALVVADGPLVGPGTRVRCTEDALLAALLDPARLPALIEGGAITVAGDPEGLPALVRAAAIPRGG